jgi:hypothetical protein
VGKLANAASSIYWITIRKRRQENPRKKVGTIPKMGIAMQAPTGLEFAGPFCLFGQMQIVGSRIISGTKK